jgi:hypothetical protein
VALGNPIPSTHFFFDFLAIFNGSRSSAVPAKGEDAETRASACWALLWRHSGLG